MKVRKSRERLIMDIKKDSIAGGGVLVPERERDREQHERLFKAASNPLRKKMAEKIGDRGITREELKKELGDVSDFEFRFNLDYLIAEGFVVEKDGKLYLTEDGVDLAYSG